MAVSNFIPAPENLRLPVSRRLCGTKPPKQMLGKVFFDRSNRQAPISLDPVELEELQRIAGQNCVPFIGGHFAEPMKGFP